MIEQILRDLRVGMRSFRRQPDTILLVISILGGSIGLVTAMFTALDWTLLRPLPYPDSTRLYSVGRFVSNVGDNRPRLSLEKFDRLQQSAIFDRLAASRWVSGALVVGDQAEEVSENLITPDFFTLFGARFAVGRPFLDSDYASAAQPVVVLSDDLWARRFGRDRGVIGRSISLNSQVYRIIGIAPADFHDPLEYRRRAPIDAWLPLTRSGTNPTQDLYSVQGHLAPSVQSSQLQKTLETMLLENGGNTRQTVEVLSLQRALMGPYERQLFLLAGAVVLVLLIACANVGGLLLVRGISRNGEMAIRLALGGSRHVLIQQQLTEVLLLSFAGTAIGLVLAFGLVRSMIRFLPQEIARISEMRVDARVILFSAAVMLFVTLCCGIWPVLSASETGVSHSLRGSSGSASQHSRWRRLGEMFVAIQVGLSLVLVVGAGLLIKSFALLANVNPGFNARSVLTAQVRLPRTIYSNSQLRSAFYASALSRLEMLPGVQSAAMVTTLPLTGSVLSEAFLVEDHPVHTDSRRPQADWNLISPNYFSAMSIGLAAGRLPLDSDLKRSADLAVVNRHLAHVYWPHGDAIGKRISFGSADQPEHWIEIIGVVDDIKQNELASPAEFQIYQLYPALSPPFASFVVRTDGDPVRVSHSLRMAIHSLDKSLPVKEIAPMSEILAGSIAAPRLRTVLLSGFGLVALLLASLGMYAAISHAVARRRHEVGIRMALGAEPDQIRRLILSSGMNLVCIGLLFGSFGSVIFMMSLRSFLFAVKPFDVVVLAASVSILFISGLAAAWIPAERARRVDPATVLRCDY